MKNIFVAKCLIGYSLLLFTQTHATAQVQPHRLDSLKPENRNTPTPVQENAQLNKKSTDFGVSDAAQFERLMPLTPGVGSNAREVLNEQSLKSHMMPPRKMGTNGQSFTYAVASAMEFYVNLNSNYKDNISPDYLRLNVPNGAPDDVFSFLANNGAVSAAIMPYDATNVPPSVYSAQKYKIKNFLKLFQPTTRGQQRIYEVRKAIMRGNPVVVELSVNNSFRTLKDTRLWNATTDPTSAGTQYVVVVGYDEERRAVEILNCGGREWGNGGYVWVSYEDFGNLAAFGYVLIM